MNVTPRLTLPFIVAGQAQKEIAHNEALSLIDIVLAGGVEGVAETPPASPQLGACHIVGANPTGAFAGKANHVAGWGEGGWRFVAPVDGMKVVMIVDGRTACYRAGAWEIGIERADKVIIGGLQVLSTQGSAIASPSGGGAIDANARTAIDAILAALRHHGLIAS